MRALDYFDLTTEEDLGEDPKLARQHAYWKKLMDTEWDAAMKQVSREVRFQEDNPDYILGEPMMTPSWPSNTTEAAAPPARSSGDIHRLNDKKISWTAHRCPLIFMMLHPAIWGSELKIDRMQKAADVLGVQRGTVYNWFALPQPGKKITVMVPQWFDIVRSMTWGSLKQRAAFKPAFFEPFNEVVKDTDTVRDQLERYKKHKGDMIVLSAYNSEISSATKKALRSKHDNVVIQLGNRNETALKSRPVKYEEADELVAKTISERWAMGDPISRPELYMELDEAFTDGTRSLVSS